MACSCAKPCKDAAPPLPVRAPPGLRSLAPPRLLSCLKDCRCSSGSGQLYQGLPPARTRAPLGSRLQQPDARLGNRVCCRFYCEWRVLKCKLTWRRRRRRSSLPICPAPARCVTSGCRRAAATHAAHGQSTWLLARAAVHRIGDAQALFQRLLVLFGRPLPRHLQGAQSETIVTNSERCRSGSR